MRIDVVDRANKLARQHALCPRCTQRALSYLEEGYTLDEVPLIAKVMHAALTGELGQCGAA